MFQKFSKKTLATIYISLFLVTLSLASVVIAFSAINANFGNQSEIYYTAADIKDGQTLNQAIKASTSYSSENTNIKRVVFDYYTTKEIVSEDGEDVFNVSYIENGENVIAGATGSSLLWDLVTVELYRIPNSDGTLNVYILSDQDIVASKIMRNSFYNLTAVEEIVFNNFALTSETTDMYNMFARCSSLKTVDFSSFDTSNVTNLSSLFHYCSSLSSIDLTPLNTSKTVSLSNLFAYCSSLSELDFSQLDTTNVTDFSYIFRNCTNLSEIKGLDKFDTSSAITMAYMFHSCSSLTEIDLLSFNTINVTDMSYMFGNCVNLSELDLSSFDTKNVTTMMRMFESCSNLKTIYISDFDVESEKGWTTQNVNSSTYMFVNCSNLPDFDRTYSDKTLAFAGFSEDLGRNGYLTIKN